MRFLSNQFTEMVLGYVNATSINDCDSTAMELYAGITEFSRITPCHGRVCQILRQLKQMELVTAVSKSLKGRRGRTFFYRVNQAGVDKINLFCKTLNGGKNVIELPTFKQAKADYPELYEDDNVLDGIPVPHSSTPPVFDETAWQLDGTKNTLLLTQ